MTSALQSGLIITKANVLAESGESEEKILAAENKVGQKMQKAVWATSLQLNENPRLSQRAQTAK
jgi:hypothetical protein